MTTETLVNRTISFATGFVWTLFLAACGAPPGSAQLGSTHDPLRPAGPDYPEAPEEPTPQARPAHPPPLYADLQLTGKAFSTGYNGEFLYLEVINLGTGDLTEQLERGTILLDGIKHHAEIPKRIRAGKTGVILDDLTYQVKSRECATYTVTIDYYGTWQQEGVPFVNNLDPSLRENDTGVVHTQCPLRWDSTITVERLGFYGESSNPDLPDLPVNDLTISDRAGATETKPGSAPSPAIARAALGTTLGTIVSSGVIVRDDQNRCSQCHYRDGVGFYRPDIEQGSTQVISEFAEFGGHIWGGYYGEDLPYYFVYALHPGTYDFEKSPALRWLMQRYRDRNQWNLDLNKDLE
jgi:hypothetical protein